MSFQSLKIQKLRFRTKIFSTFFTIQRYAKYKFKLLDFFSYDVIKSLDGVVMILEVFEKNISAKNANENY